MFLTKHKASFIEKNHMEFDVVLPVRITFGSLLFMHSLNVLNSHKNDSVVSSYSNACPNTMLCSWWFDLTNKPRGMLFLLVLYVVSNVTTSPKSTYSALWLAWLYKMFLTSPVFSSSFNFQKNFSLCFLHSWKKLISFGKSFSRSFLVYSALLYGFVL